MDWQTDLEAGGRLLWQGVPIADLRLSPVRDDVLAGLWGLISVALMALSLCHIAGKHRLLAMRMRAARYALKVFRGNVEAQHERETPTTLRGCERRALIFAPSLRPGAPARLFSLDLRADTRTDLTATAPLILSLWHWPKGANKETPAAEIHFRLLADGQTPHQTARQIMRELP